MVTEKGAEVFKISKKHLYAAIKPVKMALTEEVIYCRDNTICQHCLNNTSKTCQKFCPKTIIRDYSLCSSDCKYYNSREKNEYCKWECTKCAKIESIEKQYAINEVRNYGITSFLKPLSRLQILQYFYLCARSGGSSYAKNITAAEISKVLNCTVKSVINNMDALVIKGYILYSIYNGSYNIILNNYTDMFKTRDQGGTGYIELTKQDLSNICSIDSIRELRFYVRNELQYNKQIKIDKSTTPYIDNAYIKACFPYIVKRDLNKLLEKYKFKVGGLNNKIYYFPEATALDERVGQVKSYIFNAVQDCINKNDIKLTNSNTISDIAIAAINFGLPAATKAINLYKERSTNNNITNIGGYIRTLCQEAV